MCVNTSLYFSSIHIYLSLSYYLFVILYSILSKMDVPLWECNFDFVGQFQLSSVRLKLSQQSSRQERRAVFFFMSFVFLKFTTVDHKFPLKVGNSYFFHEQLELYKQKCCAALLKTLLTSCREHFSSISFFYKHFFH